MFSIFIQLFIELTGESGEASLISSAPRFSAFVSSQILCFRQLPDSLLQHNALHIQHGHDAEREGQHPLLVPTPTHTWKRTCSLQPMSSRQATVRPNPTTWRAMVKRRPHRPASTQTLSSTCRRRLPKMSQLSMSSLALLFIRELQRVDTIIALSASGIQIKLPRPMKVVRKLNRISETTHLGELFSI